MYTKMYNLETRATLDTKVTAQRNVRQKLRGNQE